MPTTSYGRFLRPNSKVPSIETKDERPCRFFFVVFFLFRLFRPRSSWVPQKKEVKKNKVGTNKKTKQNTNAHAMGSPTTSKRWTVDVSGSII